MTKSASPLAARSSMRKGDVNAKFTAPEDFGEVHDLYAVVDGKDVARGGFRILRSATATPNEGPVGTPITVTVKGIGWQGFEQFMALRYDNKYTGEISAVTTKGTAVFQISRRRQAPGKHIIQLNNSTAYAPGAYLNTQQSPQAYIYAHVDNQQEFRFVFNVTKDNGPPPDKLEWPDNDECGNAQERFPTHHAGREGGNSLGDLNPPTGTVNSETTLSASGLPPNIEVDLYFVTARGNRMTPSGWNLDNVPLSKAMTKPDGSLTTTVRIPDDLGGWHAIKLIARDQVLGEMPYYVEQSLVKVTPKRVKVGEPFTCRSKVSAGPSSITHWRSPTIMPP